MKQELCFSEHYLQEMGEEVNKKQTQKNEFKY